MLIIFTQAIAVIINDSAISKPEFISILVRSFIMCYPLISITMLLLGWELRRDMMKRLVPGSALVPGVERKAAVGGCRENTKNRLLPATATRSSWDENVVSGLKGI